MEVRLSGLFEKEDLLLRLAKIPTKSSLVYDLNMVLFPGGIETESKLYFQVFVW